MTRVTLAIVITADGTRYKVSGWRNGSTRTSSPSRPARLVVLTDSAGWKPLEEWNGATQQGSGSLTEPKPDDAVLEEAISRIEETYGKEVSKIDYRHGSETNHLGMRMGYNAEALAEYPKAGQ